MAAAALVFGGMLREPQLDTIILWCVLTAFIVVSLLPLVGYGIGRAFVSA